MNRSGSYPRQTPSDGTPATGGSPVVSEGRASYAVARALGQLVGRLMMLEAGARDGEGAGTEAFDIKLSAVRDALRQLAARSRDGAMLCRVANGTLILDGEARRSDGSQSDALLRLLETQLNELQVGSLTIREGAAPGELLTLARMLADPAAGESAPVVSTQTPTAVHAVDFASETPRELLRTWSVLVTPVRKTADADGVAVAPGSVLSHFTGARSDASAKAAADAVVDLLDELQRRGDSPAIESVARVVMTHVGLVNEGPGRLACERVIRQLSRAPVLTLLAKQLPHSTDRTTLLKLFSRAGDVGASILVDHLLATDDAMSRRAYFDSIVAMNVGSTQLFAALTDSRWYVVRNAAALLGEMGVSHADEHLMALLKNADDRIRIAVARALMRLRTTKALHALHSVIDDTNSEVRRLSAVAFGLSGSSHANIRPPAARLSAALDKEVDEDAALEMMAALGRLGSADAVQRLLRIALPPTADITGAIVGEKREAWQRIAALEALVKARGHQMQPVVDALANDEDIEVAYAATELRGR